MGATPTPVELGTSLTQPPPTEGTGESLHDVAARDAAAYRYPRVMDLVLERKAFGLGKYGKVLRAHNGRNPLCDAMDELLDALVYLAQARVEGRPHATLLYHAVLAIAGACSRVLPPEAALPPRYNTRRRV